jgi:penicillin amidase
MKTLRRLLLGLLLLIGMAAATLYGWLLTTRPQMSGFLDLTALQDTVEVQFDEFGIPHIFAKNETDAYYALGYVHAQERLFQMEMLRRLAAGRLSEILGADLVETDRFFRTIGLAEAAKKNAQTHFSVIDKSWKKAALAYLQGINDFIDRGNTPPEFILLGIDKENYTPEDFYLVNGYMAFSFAQAFRTDPLLDKMYRQLGENYLKDFSLNFDTAVTKIPVHLPKSSVSAEKVTSRLNVTASFPARNEQIKSANEVLLQVAKLVNQIDQRFPLLQGSNGWVIAPSRSKSGRVILANDTHIGYAQPSVWFEAHISYPGLNFYGNYLAGFPFAVLGHSPDIGWGLTMFENDDIDFYRLKALDSQSVEIDGKAQALQVRKEIIRVKGGTSIDFEVKISPFGVILNDVLKPINDGLNYVPQSNEAPVAMWWTLHEFPTNSLEAVYILTRAKNLQQAKVGVAMLDVPGLNVMFGDAEGNIAWWATGKLPKRNPTVRPEFILDGSTVQSLPQGYHPFEENPQSINPPSGFVYSANNQPGAVKNYLQPGYYLANDRADYITAYLNNERKWSAEDIAQMALDVKSGQAVKNISVIISQLKGNFSADEQKALALLKAWDGNHTLDAAAPVIYYKLMHHLHMGIFEDEIGADDLKILIHTHVLYRSFAKILNNEASLWWDKTNTPEKETREQIISTAFRQSIADLVEQFGTNDMAQWQWGKVHTIEHVHPIGRQKPFNRLFNVGPFPVVGGKEVINNISFTVTGSGLYPASFGPAMRRVIDFADPLHSKSVLPTGESGHFMSKHYGDQAVMYNTGQYRFQRMDKADIEANSTGKLTLY